MRYVVLFLVCTIVNIANATTLTTCKLHAKIMYSPALIDGFYWMRIYGLNATAITSDFCYDRLGKQTQVKVPEYNYSKRAHPKRLNQIELIESKKDTLVGGQIVSIRYFTESP